MNNIGIYHLSGENWMHMLSTIPKYPYKCVILLDGDKKKRVNSISKLISIHFKSCETLSELQYALNNLNDADKPNPLYCLKNNKIESYLDSGLKSNITNYIKKIHGPKIAEEMKEIPNELSEIFDVLFK